MPLLEAAFSPVLVGRTREIEFLNQALGAARNGAGRCVLLAGEAGIGKSRLAAEIRSRAVDEHWTILQGHCSEQDTSFPYAPWIDALRTFLARKNTAETGELLGPLAPELVKLLPELSLLIPAIQPTPTLDPAAEKHRLFESLTRFAASLAAKNPLLIILEDLHWSDEPSFDLLHFFVRRIAPFPIFLVGTLRNEELPPHLAHRLAQLKRDGLIDELLLTPLARSEVEEMARAIQRSADSIAANWLDTLMRLTEGNPFFVEEILKSLPEVGRRLPEAGKLDERRVPRSIQDLVQRRSERLPERTRQILSLAAVIGERFDFGLLREVAAVDEPSLLHALKELIKTQLIFEESADQFVFRHALTREAVYALLMQRERRAMHQMIGETVERLIGARVDATAAPPAYHFYHAQVWQKAIVYSQRAGEQAQALYAPREALTHFSHAIQASQKLGAPPPTVCLRGRAQAYEVLGEFDYARSDYGAALESTRRGENRVDEWQLLIDLGLLWQSRDLERAGEYYVRALELANMLGDSSILARTLNRLGNWHMNRGQAREALPFHREALELFRKFDDRRGMAQTLDLLGIVSYQVGEVIQGAAYLEQAVPILRELDDRQGLVHTLTNLAVRARTDTEVLGDINYMQMTNPCDEALQIARSFSWYHGEALALMQGAICLEQAGEYGQAIERLTRAQSIVDESRNRESFARLHFILGQVFIGLLAFAEASQHLETGLPHVQKLGSGLLTVAATAQLASVALMQNDLERARAFLAPLLPAEYPPGGQELAPQRRCWSVRAELELVESNPHRALEIVEHLITSAPNLDRYGPHAVPRLSRLRAQALAALKRTEEAESELRGTLPIAQRQGQRPMVWRLDADLGKVYLAMGRRDDAEREFAAARTIIHSLADNVPEGALRENFLRRALATIPAAHVPTPRQAAKNEFGGLTARERGIATLIADGKSNREIANALFISETTVERHVANILSKLAFNSRTQIAVWAVEKGLGQ